MKRVVRRQNNDYYRGQRDARSNRQPEPGHSRMSRATIDYMAGYNDQVMEQRRQ